MRVIFPLSFNSFIILLISEPGCSTSLTSLNTRISSLFPGILLQLKKKNVITLSGDKAAIQCHRDPVTENLKYRRYLPFEIIMDDSIDDNLSIFLIFYQINFIRSCILGNFISLAERSSDPAVERVDFAMLYIFFSHIDHQSLLLSSVG